MSSTTPSLRDMSFSEMVILPKDAQGFSLELGLKTSNAPLVELLFSSLSLNLYTFINKSDSLLFTQIYESLSFYCKVIIFGESSKKKCKYSGRDTA